LDAISVLVWNLPRMLSDIVCALLREAPHIRVFAAHGSAADWLHESERSAADVVVTVSERGQAPAGADELLLQRPDLKVLGLEGETSHAYLFTLSPRKKALGTLSAQGLIAAIREAASETRDFQDVPDGAGQGSR
jgi:hypothetical protein